MTLPLAQANDALGYVPQSFELNPVGQQGAGFALGGVAVVNYEDAYAIDRCFGDMVLETTLHTTTGVLRLTEAMALDQWWPGSPGTFDG